MLTRQIHLNFVAYTVLDLMFVWGTWSSRIGGNKRDLLSYDLEPVLNTSTYTYDIFVELPLADLIDFSQDLSVT